MPFQKYYRKLQSTTSNDAKRCQKMFRQLHSYLRFYEIPTLKQQTHEKRICRNGLTCVVSFLKKRDHSKWCDDEIKKAGRASCNQRCQSCTVWGQFAGIGVHLLRAIGLLQRGEVHDVVVYLRESKGGKRIHGVRCCISKWFLFQKRDHPKNTNCEKRMLLQGRNSVQFKFGRHPWHTLECSASALVWRRRPAIPEISGRGGT